MCANAERSDSLVEKVTQASSLCCSAGIHTIVPKRPTDPLRKGVHPLQNVNVDPTDVKLDVLNVNFDLPKVAVDLPDVNFDL